jgi:hypothetical protein
MDNCIIYDDYIKNKKIYIINKIYDDITCFVKDYNNLVNLFKNYDIVAYKIKKDLKIKNENEIIYKFNDTCELIYNFKINNINNINNISIIYNPPCLKDNIDRFLQIGFINNYITIKNLNKYDVNINISYTCYLFNKYPYNFITNNIINNTQLYINGIVMSIYTYYYWGKDNELKEYIINYIKKRLVTYFLDNCKEELISKVCTPKNILNWDEDVLLDKNHPLYGYTQEQINNLLTM